MRCCCCCCWHKKYAMTMLLCIHSFFWYSSCMRSSGKCIFSFFFFLRVHSLNALLLFFVVVCMIYRCIFRYLWGMYWRCCWLSVYVRDSDGRRYCVLLCCCACVPNGNKIWFFFLLWLFVKYTWHFALLLCIKMYLYWTHTGEEFICVSGDAPNKMCVLCVCCEESWTGGGWNYCF